MIRRLRELDSRSGGRRVAWTGGWEQERERFVADLRADVPGVQVDRDEAGNLWAVVPGRADAIVLAGSHLDTVPDGGWLDGCLGVLAAAEVLRQAAAAGTPAQTLALVDWADEEGARFGHSLLGSSAAAGILEVERAAGLVDADGVALPDALSAHGVWLEDMPRARRRLDGITAHVELHIEQGPVLDEAGLPVAAVDGCLGVRRRELRFTGQAAHAGATPMAMRRDPVAAVAGFSPQLAALALEHGGLATIGSMRAEPGTPTAVPAAVRLTTDLRHRDLPVLESFDAQALELARRAAGEARCGLEQRALWSIDPISFDPGLVERAARLVPGGTTLTSGPLHDAAAVALAGVPTVMLFARTLGGISHSRQEDARDEDLATAIEAFGSLVLELAGARS